MLKRKEAREIALHMIFEMGYQPFDTERLDERLDAELLSSVGDELPFYGEDASEQLAYIRKVVSGVQEQKDELDTVIEQHAKGWKLSRLSRMTVAILRLALYEMKAVDDVPTGAAINEAVELAKQYDSEEAASFVNGILGAVARAEAKAPEAAEAPTQAEHDNG